MGRGAALKMRIMRHSLENNRLLFPDGSTLRDDRAEKLEILGLREQSIKDNCVEQ